MAYATTNPTEVTHDLTIVLSLAEAERFDSYLKTNHLRWERREFGMERKLAAARAENADEVHFVARGFFPIASFVDQLAAAGITVAGLNSR